jgi:hypothetical protein
VARRGASAAIVLTFAFVTAFGGCDAGNEPARDVVPTRSTPAAPSDADERYTAAIASALAADAKCVEEGCSTPAGLERRASAIADAVRPFDDALAAIPTMDAKRTRAVTSAFRHSARQLQTCFQLSAAKHGGTPELAECAGPVAEFRRAVRALRTALG